jgi:hypothetical protein
MHSKAKQGNACLDVERAHNLFPCTKLGSKTWSLSKWYETAKMKEVEFWWQRLRLHAAVDSNMAEGLRQVVGSR